MAKPPPIKKPKPKPKPKPPTVPDSRLPGDFVRGSKVIGQDYTAWETANKRKPDFGKGKGPGDPYREVTKKMAPAAPALPTEKPKGHPGFGRLLRSKMPANPKKDLRVNAIKRRLGVL